MRGANELFKPGLRARNDQGALVERQHLAKRVVTAHRHNRRRPGCKRFHVAVEGNGFNAIELRRPRHERSLSRWRHERPEHEQRGVGQQQVVLVRPQHPLDQVLTVASAAGRHQQVRPLSNRMRRLCIFTNRQFAMQIAGINHFLAHTGRERNTLQRIADLRQSVDPDLIVQIFQCRHHVLAPPLRCEQLRIIHHIAQTEHQSRAARLQHLQGLQHFATQADRFLVYYENVGPEYLGRMPNHGRAHREHFSDIDV